MPTSIFGSISGFFKELFTSDISDKEKEEVKAFLLERSNNFRNLLTFNYEALAVMIELEGNMYRGEQVSLLFLSSRLERVFHSISNMINALTLLDPQRHIALYQRLSVIHAQIALVLESEQTMKTLPFVLPLSETAAGKEGIIGDKMARLIEAATKLGCTIPAGFVLTSEAYRIFMQEVECKQERILLEKAVKEDNFKQLFTVSQQLQEKIRHAVLPSKLIQEIRTACSRYINNSPKTTRLAVRSSAVGEDGKGASFAGQFCSEMGVTPDNIYSAYRSVAASKYLPSAVSYRQAMGLRDEDMAMCVGVMQMVDAVAGGVAYSTDPLSSKKEHISPVVYAVPGLPLAVVDGSSPVDVYSFDTMDSPAFTKQTIAQKYVRFFLCPLEGIARRTLSPEEGRISSLSNEQAYAVAKLALELEQYFKEPQDIEWAFDKEGTLFLLQCRPLVVMEANKTETKILQHENLLFEGGITASPGCGSGKICIVRSKEDFSKVSTGCILVIPTANPVFAPLLPKASALVAFQGNAGGHLACIAREFGVPALFNTQVEDPDLAERLWSNGKEVTVDATSRAILEGIHPEFVTKNESKEERKKQSVSDVLSQICELIVPLHLTDPDSENFLADNCKTLHDITRYCHEMAVRKMFSSKNNTLRLPSAGGKQLVYDSPMQYWIIDLGKGLSKPTTDKRIDFSEITSIPMKILWDGMMRIPWEGPPSVDMQGFMSAMAMGGAGASSQRLGDRSYFIINEDYVNLQSRFGFHFATVEAQLGNVEEENYLFFRFSGGATDIQRRIGRARLIEDLLVDNGFTVVRNEDVVSARIESGSVQNLTHKLRILGYLTMHTRQIDMVMNNPARVHGYKKSFEEDIQSLAAPNKNKSDYP